MQYLGAAPLLKTEGRRVDCTREPPQYRDERMEQCALPPPAFSADSLVFAIPSAVIAPQAADYIS
jgi:hypothetical protein